MNIDRRRLSATTLVAVGALVPLVVCLLLSTVRDQMANTNVALVLVLVIVGAASFGTRAAGWSAAVVSAAGFDIFLTQPYGELAIHSAADVQTTVLLLGIGVAVTELALWGRRHQARASEQHGYLDGILQTTEALADTTSSDVLIDHVERQLVELLDLDRARYVRRLAVDAPVIEADGSVSRRGHPIDVDRSGLPTDTEVWLPVGQLEEDAGGFRLVASAHIARPTRQQLQVAALLAERVAHRRRQEANHR